ncbi:MAG: hypothetical protein JSW20_03665 [Nitrospiraceae bacterium]|nr:MAG: hypothetical protein JSW20_03665 [Nitrospiraceae bacterium]
MPSISVQCPSCGRQDLGAEEQCECGFFNSHAIMAEFEKKSIDTVKRKSIKNIDEPVNNKPDKELILKEIDSWVLTFSPEDNCINLSTPALNAFKLKITLEDLEELLEVIYKVTDRQKTLRKLQLSVEAIPELVLEVNRLIEEKRSKVSIAFDEGELKEIEEFINQKLME